MGTSNWRAGAITKIADHYRRQGVKNDFGEIEENWTKLSTIRLRVVPKRGRQTIDTDEEFDMRVVDFFMRKQHDIKETDRLFYRGKFYDIDFVDEDYDEMWLRIRASKINE